MTSDPRHTVSTPGVIQPHWLALCVHSIALTVLSGSIIRFNLPDSLLLGFLVPCILAAHFYRRWVYRTMLATLVAATVWVTVRVSLDVTASLISIALAAISGVIIAEMHQTQASALDRARTRERVDRQGKERRHLTEMGLALLDCDQADLVFDRLGDFLSQVISDEIIIINEATADQRSLITRQVIGLEGTLWAQVEKLAGFKIIGKVSPIATEWRDYFFQTRLLEIPGGFSTLAASEIPETVARVAENLFSMHSVFTIGIADRDTIWGNIHIITRRPTGPGQTVHLPTRLIEAGVYQCFSTLSRIKAIQQLTLSEQKYRLLFQNLPTGFCLHEILLDEDQQPCDYRFLEMNPAFEALTGLKAGDVMGRTVLETLPGIETRWIETYGRVVTTGEPVHFESYSRELGRYYQVTAYAAAPGRFATIFLDTTELRQIQEAQQLRLRYEAGLAACSHVLLAGTPQALTDALEHLRQATGASRAYIFENLVADGRLCMRQIAEASAPDTAPQIDNPELQCLPYDAAWPNVATRLAQGEGIGGCVADLPLEERPILEAQGILSILVLPIQVNGDWYGFVGFDDCVEAREWRAKDIGLLQTAAHMIGRYIEHKQAEAERRQAEEALREKSEELDKFFSTALDLLCIADTDGYFRRINAEWEKTLGYSLSELEGRQFLDFVHPDDLGITLETMASLGEGQEILNFTNRYRHKDGTCRWIEWRSFPSEGLIYAAARDITERTEAEETLRASQVLLDLFFTQSLDGFFFMMLDEPLQWDEATDRECALDYALAHHRITRVNDAMLAQYRATREQFLGKTPNELFSHDLVHGRSVYRDFFDAGHLHIDTDERRLDGTPMWIEGDYVCLYDAQGRITGHFGVQRDVTEQRRVITALKEHEQFLVGLNEITRAALETSDLPAMLHILAERMGELFDADGAYLTLWDEEAQMTVAGAAYGALHDRYRMLKIEPGEPTLTATVLRTGETLAIEDVLDTPHLSRRIATLFPDRSLLGLPLVAGERKLGAALIAYIKTHKFTPLEVTRGEQVAKQIALAVAKARLYEELEVYAGQLEARVRERTAELQAQYAQLDAILRSVGDAICMTDPAQTILYVNPAFTSLTGYPENEVLGCGMQSLEAWGDFAPRLASILPDLMQGRLRQEDVRVQRRDGRAYDAVLTVTPVCDETGQVTGYLFSHRDISQAKNLERARNQFIANVSHQFRTPLTPLKIGIYMLKRAKLEPRYQQQLLGMEAGIDWLIHLIEDTQEILVLDSGKGATLWAPVPLQGLVEEVAGHYRGQAQAAGLTLETAFCPDLPPVQGDGERLAQALSEMVENAIVFTPAWGHVTVAARTSVVEGEGWVTVAVQDTGPGISAEELPRLSERFFRGTLAESGHTAGVGLGLSIAWKIAEAHGGHITVESVVGQGSTFTLWLRSVVRNGGKL